MSPHCTSDARKDERTNMFLAALLHGDGFHAPVKIRNMSVTGALVEAAAVPDSGAEVRLVRGSLMVPATVAWSASGRCGLRFSSLVSVRDWLAPPGNSAQARVDDAVRLLNLGAVPLPQRPSQSGAPEGSSAQLATLGEDLQRVAAMIEELGDELATDDQVLLRHSAKLQNLDIALQTISVVAKAMVSGADEHLAARLENLRSSAIAAAAPR